MQMQTITVLIDGEPRNYITVEMAAKKWSAKESTIHVWHRRGKIPGSFNIGKLGAKGVILIPEDAVKPKPISNGRPRKKKQKEGE